MCPRDARFRRIEFASALCTSVLSALACALLVVLVVRFLLLVPLVPALTVCDCARTVQLLSSYIRVRPMCWTVRTPTELESQQLDASYKTYGRPTEDGKETKLQVVPAPYLATMDWSSAALDVANGRTGPLTDTGYSLTPQPQHHSTSINLHLHRSIQPSYLPSLLFTLTTRGLRAPQRRPQ